MLYQLIALVTKKPIFAPVALAVGIRSVAKQPRQVIGASLIMAGLTVFLLPLLLLVAQIGLRHVPGNAPVPLQLQFALLAAIVSVAGVIAGWLIASLFAMPNRRFAASMLGPFFSIGLWCAHVPAVMVISLPLGGGMLIGALLAERVTRFGAFSVAS